MADKSEHENVNREVEIAPLCDEILKKVSAGGLCSIMYCSSDSSGCAC